LATSPNVVPFPTLPDRALDERLEHLVDQYASIVRAQMPPRCGDIEQDALVRLWRALRDVRNIDIYRVAVANAIEAVRRAVTRRPESIASTTDYILIDALSKLPASTRRFVELRLQTFEISDIANILRCSKSKARRTTNRGMNELREILKRR